MPYLNDLAFDGGLTALLAATRLDVCSTEPATYTAATSTNSLGNKTSIGMTGPAAGSPNGRQNTIPAITNGAATGTGSASHYALTDPANSRLWATNALAASQSITTGNTFSLPAFTIRFPAAVSA